MGVHDGRWCLEDRDRQEGEAARHLQASRAPAARIAAALRRSDGANRAVVERRLSQNRCARRTDWRTIPGRSVVSDPRDACASLRDRLTLALSVAGGPLSMDGVRDAGGPPCATRWRALRADRRLS